MRGSFVVLLALGLAAPAVSAQTVSDGGAISIMRPEPHAKPRKYAPRKPTRRHYKERTSRGSSNPVYPAPLPGPEKPRPVPHYQPPSTPQRPKTPPPMFVPETGRTLPNLRPAAPGLGSGGKESFPQRAARCAHQAGVYGPNATGNPSAYINSCINQ
ncbi:MAG: hypothetical protein P8Y53_12115 [Pseudolabrys sp.]|jgi:hypothetical protein